MKRLKYNIIYLIGLLVLSCAIITTFAAFIFVQTASVNARLGDIRINSKNYLIYAYEHNLDETSADFERAECYRNDAVAIIESVEMDKESGYKKTEDTAINSNKTYYTRTGDEPNYIYTAVNEPIAGNLSNYYEANVEYHGIESAAGYYYNTTEDKFSDLVVTISGTNKDTIQFTVNSVNVTINCTFGDGAIVSASVTVSNKNYKVVIGTDGLSMIVIDEDLSAICKDDVEDGASYGYEKINANNKIICSATKEKYKDSESSGTKYYLSQIGLRFSFTSEIAAYVRIHIQDAWTRTRQYSSNSSSKYVMKDQIGGKSPFAVTDSDWYYDANTNYVYLKEMYDPSKNLDEDGNVLEQTYTFNVNEAYYYLDNDSTAYTDYIDVDLSFTVEIVQANRIKSKWKMDPSDFNA